MERYLERYSNEMQRYLDDIQRIWWSILAQETSIICPLITHAMCLLMQTDIAHDQLTVCEPCPSSFVWTGLLVLPVPAEKTLVADFALVFLGGDVVKP